MNKIKLFENFDETQNDAKIPNSLIVKTLVFDDKGIFKGMLDENSTEEDVKKIFDGINESNNIEDAAKVAGLTLYQVAAEATFEMENFSELDEGLMDFLGLTFKSKVKKAEKTLEALSRSVKKKDMVEFKTAEYKKYKDEFEAVMKKLGGDAKKADDEEKKIIDIYQGIVYMLTNNGDFKYTVNAKKGKVGQTSGYGTENTAMANLPSDNN